MTIRSIGWIASVAMLAGCAMTERQVGLRTAAAPQSQIESMTYATTPCHGSCPVYTVIISANGAGVFTGANNTAVVGERHFTATPEQAATFFNQLQSYLPVGELLLTSLDACKTYATDLPSVDVKWIGKNGSGHLLFDAGCDPGEHHALAKALRVAPQALPIAELIGKR